MLLIVANAFLSRLELKFGSFLSSKAPGVNGLRAVHQANRPALIIILPPPPLPGFTIWKKVFLQRRPVQRVLPACEIIKQFS